VAAATFCAETFDWLIPRPLDLILIDSLHLQAKINFDFNTFFPPFFFFHTASDQRLLYFEFGFNMKGSVRLVNFIRKLFIRVKPQIRVTIWKALHNAQSLKQGSGASRKRHQCRFAPSTAPPPVENTNRANWPSELPRSQWKTPTVRIDPYNCSGASGKRHTVRLGH